MKKRHEEWLKLSGRTPAPAIKTAQPPIRVIDLPNFQRMEDKLWINPPVRGILSPDVEAFANSLSKETFGIVENDTLFENPEGYNDFPEWSEERQEIDDLYYEHENQFETADSTDDEAVEILLRLGLDFRDSRGFPLRCIKLFCRQAEASAKGIIGKMPDRAAISLASWTETLERDAKKHMNRKRAG